MKGLDAKALLDQLEQMYDDLQAALQWFLDHERTDECLRLAISLAPFWMATKRLDEGPAWCDRARASPGGEDSHRRHVLLPGGPPGLLDGRRRARSDPPWSGRDLDGGSGRSPAARRTAHDERMVSTLGLARGAAELNRVRATGRSMRTAEAVRFALGGTAAG